MDIPALEKLLIQFKPKQILCIGDIILDRFVTGEVNRISPEAPIPVLHQHHQYFSLGGAGNVVRNLSALEVPCYFVSTVGDDANGRRLIKMASQLPYLKHHIITDPLHSTICKTRYLCGNQQLLRVDQENVLAIAPTLESIIIKLVRDIIPMIEVMILSDYAKGLLTKRLISEVIGLAKEAQKFVIVDPKGYDFSCYQQADIITPNQNELSLATGIEIYNRKTAVLASEQILQTCGIPNVLVTRGAEGMCLVRAQKPPLHIRTHAQEIFDLAGAGDTVVAAMAAFCSMNASLDLASELANIAAGIVVTKVGTATVNTKEIQHALTHQSHQQSEKKIVLLEEGVELCHHWHRKQFKVGFTNGCFDLLHPGHIALLTEAHQQCDRLIVGLNNDASVKRLKGEGRPIQDEDTRSLVLASLRMVDLVILFQEDTPLELIKALKPDLLFKGKDYKIEEIVGADIIQKAGGQVILVDLVPNYSTSNLLQRLENHKK
jgi:D-beta-D-heptose 7-phosphate kinase / D-beta-D-heptose 1-phosphate adenosyltransferase